MSRTDATTPLWVRATWFRPKHFCSTYASTWLPVRGGPCDLPPEPRRIHPRIKVRTHCEWVPQEDEYWRTKWYHWPVPRHFTRLVWRDPQRVLVRNQLVRARQEYNGSGDTDVVPSTAQHRHNAVRLYW
jgi:hypothetical protein